MGKDGAKKLTLIEDSGGVTIAQDEESSVVPGMPGTTIGIRAVTHILSPIHIALFLTSIGSKR